MIENENNLQKRNHSMIKMTPCPRDADLKNGSHRKGERTHLQNNDKEKPEQLKLSKIDPSIWP
jgi:hypothetical protein